MNRKHLLGIALLAFPFALLGAFWIGGNYLCRTNDAYAWKIEFTETSKTVYCTPAVAVDMFLGITIQQSVVIILVSFLTLIPAVSRVRG